ncbi:hypothetical protein M3Y96_00409700 [Aphelenchoides besseyi]|nr:hypothetical protein M3Y96_00409700 [Aphelenchoides besseyi]
MEGEDQLQLSPLPLDVPVGVKVFGFFDGFLYGLAYQNRSKTDSGRPIDLVKISLSNGQHVREPTKNYEIVKHICIRSTRFHVLCWKTIVCDYPSPIRSKDEISSLDLETLEWKRTNIEFDSICSIGGDGSQPLMVATLGNDPSKYNVYRVNFK